MNAGAADSIYLPSTVRRHSRTLAQGAFLHPLDPEWF